MIFKNSNYKSHILLTSVWGMLLLLLISCNKNDELIPDFTTSNTGPYLYSIEHLELIRDSLHNNSLLFDEYNTLITGADRLLTQTFTFVTDKQNLPPSGDINDYMSLAPYITSDSRGVYTAGDSMFNPERLNYDRPKLAAFSNAVHTLSLAYYFSKNDRYAEKASQLLHAWFFNPETRMNPNLNFAQVDLRENDLRGMWQGIIDSNDFILVIEAVSLLYDSQHWSPENHKDLKEWFFEFTQWIRGKNSLNSGYNPDYACDERGCYNPSSWFDLQKSLYYLFTEQEELVNSNSHIQPISEKLNRQFTPEGRQPFEQNRSRSQHYYYYNLKAILNLVTVRKNRTGYDRDWSYIESNDVSGVKSAINHLTDFLGDGNTRGFFAADPGFNTCRYLEIFKPAAIVFNEPVYTNAANQLLANGCRNPDINLTFPSTDLLTSSSVVTSN